MLSRELDLASGTLTAAAVSAFLDAQGFGAANGQSADTAAGTAAGTAANADAAENADAANEAHAAGPRAQPSPPPRHAKLLALPLSSLTADRVASLAAEKANALQALAQLQATPVVALWRHDLAALEQELRKDPKLALGQRAVFLPTVAAAKAAAPLGSVDASAPAARAQFAK